MNHTKGPWRTQIFTSSTTLIKADGYSKAIAEVRGENMRANANLIAAAPEMLEELEQLREALNDGVLSTSSKTMNSEMLYNIRKIIKKARGEL